MDVGAPFSVFLWSSPGPPHSEGTVLLHSGWKSPALLNLSGHTLKDTEIGTPVHTNTCIQTILIHKNNKKK